MPIHERASQDTSMDVVLTFAPIPADAFLDLSLSGEDQSGTISITDIYGRTMWKQEVTNGQHRIRTAELPEGYYILNCQLENKRLITRTFIVVH